MQTRLDERFQNTPQGREAETILRSCVHCGFCLATCPTYQLSGNELDSPRGRIYLIKQLLEGSQVTRKTQLHLDRCLTCRACESTCPSGVDYARLLDIGRNEVEQTIMRSPIERMLRFTLRKVLPNRGLFAFLLKSARLTRPLLPKRLQRMVPTQPKIRQNSPPANHSRRILILQGCVQPALNPDINHAAKRVLDKLGITLVEAQQAGCCGALAYHLDAQPEGLDAMRRLIDAWWRYIADPDKPIEAIVVTASGCGVTVKDYGHLLRHDPAYAEKAARVSELAKDIGEIVAAELPELTRLLENRPVPEAEAIAFHAPCTLQHGQRLDGVVENILKTAGFRLTRIAEAHLCCGSAGTYSIVQPHIARQLRDRKIAALTRDDPAIVVTANIGCQMHLQNGTQLPVRHWIEILDRVLCGETGDRYP
ncbi:glycolate oxidase subunit GlcF [Methylotuvimicrobium buryatense]|uniref:Glycolate oxidase iron-sulfur subunit n=1 Tax=Methylotuvimicrobium buryatense TaxID=95641 RepID=A0A4P9UPG4_METBY|nr:glycolate oxidase subunit GlcF [Methylotuvimicrobium buryatense]QCW83157.1 glycolate oxidase subunit GlcF [Methylotuvimicrobium buryatense]